MTAQFIVSLALLVVLSVLCFVAWMRRAASQSPLPYEPNRDCHYRFDPSMPLTYDDQRAMRAKTHADRIAVARRKLASERSTTQRVVQMADARRKAQ